MKMANLILTEQDPALKTVMTRALTRSGHMVRHASNAAILWQWLSEGDGDITIIDAAVPDASVSDLVPKIKAMRPELLIFVTGPAGLTLDLTCLLYTSPSPRD